MPELTSLAAVKNSKSREQRNVLAKSEWFSGSSNRLTGASSAAPEPGDLIVHVKNQACTDQNFLEWIKLA
jgi:hypothetical protein